jgi:clorobiocin biosynthesis protein CloN4
LLPYPIVRSLLAMPRAWEPRAAFTAAEGALGFGELRAGMLGFGGWLVREAGVRPGDRVAICLPKSLKMVLALHGALAAGAAFVGLQHRGPNVRLFEILASTSPRLLITTRETRDRLTAQAPAALPPILALEASGGLELLPRSGRPLEDAVAVGPDDLAAIVFTSGSTGEPKGVMRTQRNLAGNVASHVRGEKLGPADMRPGNTPLHYISPNLFYPAACGCRVHLLSDQDVMFPEIVAEMLEREQATTWASAATALRLLVERGELGKRELSRMRLVKSYGERISLELLQAVMAAFPQARIISAYGSTEAPNIAAYEAPRPLPERLRAVPLGSVEPDYGVRLCDENGEEVPAGEVGEICAIGPTVSPGYWRDEALTAARRLHGQADSYRTGDLGYFGSDGLLHFAGRRDHMVKLRGHRFDLGEIEAALRQHPKVRDVAAIILRGPDGETEILAAVETEHRNGLEAELKQLCADRLPRFAWPVRLRFLSDLPRLATGKVDRAKLSAEESDPAPRTTGVA